ncbi:MAG TPA: DUF417 family protein [Pseudonocardiaceae bacterium]|nr:DUF417 family protein [Pseudonocardiaceae bacterium]
MTAAQPFEAPSDTGKMTVDVSQVDSAGAAAIPLTDRRESIVVLTTRIVDQIGLLSARISLPLLRGVLGLVYIWFGLLKVVGKSEVFNLIAVTLPFVNPHVFVPWLGVVEILLGIGLLAGRVRRFVLFGVLGHLAGTFLTFITAPSWMWRGGDPLMLTTDGEFVLKNLVLISGALILLGVTSKIRKGSAEGPVAPA